jgi:hypothetical protein
MVCETNWTMESTSGDVWNCVTGSFEVMCAFEIEYISSTSVHHQAIGYLSRDALYIYMIKSNNGYIYPNRSSTRLDLLVSGSCWLKVHIGRVEISNW